MFSILRYFPRRRQQDSSRVEPRDECGYITRMRNIKFVVLLALALGCHARTPTPRKAGAQVDPVAVQMEQLQAKDPATRQQAARTLANIGRNAEAASPALIQALKDENPLVRREAAWALAKIGSRDKAIVPFLVDMLKDKSAEVRGTAIRALGSIGPQAAPAVPALVDGLEHGDQLTRKLAAEALGRIGREAKAAVPALRQALDADPIVARAAREALGRIEAKEGK
jgi:HEAT repeat protein